jgi:hypothetical protein
MGSYSLYLAIAFALYLLSAVAFTKRDRTNEFFEANLMFILFTVFMLVEFGRYVYQILRLYIIS